MIFASCLKRDSIFMISSFSHSGQISMICSDPLIFTFA
nr:MAG TPA: hypothetical protein [Caudoviricetes sp.]